MQETFIELVPRAADSLQGEMAALEQRDIAFDGFNLPELKRKTGTFLTPEELMTLHAAGRLSPEKKLALHLRTQERSVGANIERIQTLAAAGVDIALLVTGDAFDPGQEPATCAHQVLDAIDCPMGINIAAGADLYMPEWGRWGKKQPAIKRGVVDSAFTQPVFHPEVLGSLGKQSEPFSKEALYAGITWVTSAKSRDYWRTTNQVPEKHLPSGESDDVIRRNSIAQAAEIFRLAKQEGYSTYIMLMRGTLADLEEIFKLSENNRD